MSYLRHLCQVLRQALQHSDLRQALQQYLEKNLRTRILVDQY